MDLTKAIPIFVGRGYRILCNPLTHLHYIDVSGYAVRQQGDCDSWIELEAIPHCVCKQS